MKEKLILIAIVVLAILLRFYSLGKAPLSLYWDEASIGYNAYSISQTLHDEHGEYLPLARFVAFGDYKAPGFIYADALSIKLFGLSELTIRLPSAVAGTLLVVAAYLLVLELFSKKKVALAAAFITAISPWAVQFSRAAFEANVATAFSGFGFLFLLRFFRQKNVFVLISSAIFLVASMYSFNTHRVFVPLAVFALTLLNLRQILPAWKKYLVFCALFAGLLIPQVPYLMAREGSLRFNEVTWFNDLAPVDKSSRYIREDGGNVVANFLHNRRVEYVIQFAKHYTDHFNWDFLFIRGDVNPRLSSQGAGVFYFFEAIFLLAGIYFLFKNRSRAGATIFLWIALGLIPAAVARETPHALRVLNLIPIPQIIVAVGLVSLLEKRKVIKMLTVLAYSLTVIYFFHYYFIHYPKDFAREWQFGYKELVAYVSSVEKNYDYVKVDSFYGRPYIYFLLYKQYDPEKYLIDRKTDRDWYGFWNVRSFGKYYFDSADKLSGKGLIVLPPTTEVGGIKPVKQIFDPFGQPVFNIYRS
jgi:4-amino-4-deoxy-L-arabinose transferase-like glycosyltransferase